MELLVTGAIVFLGGVPALVYVCLRGVGWEDEDVPVVRWILNRKLKRFARATAAGDFEGAERASDEIFLRASTSSATTPI